MEAIRYGQVSTPGRYFGKPEHFLTAHLVFFAYLCSAKQNRQEYMQLTINLKEGVGDLRFGMPVESVVALLGVADRVDTIDNATNETTTIMEYDDLEMTLFFEEENPVLASIGLRNEEASLMGQHVFELDEAAIVDLMAKAGYTETDCDDEDWGERRVSFPQANADLFFDAGELMSIDLGA